MIKPIAAAVIYAAAMIAPAATLTLDDAVVLQSETLRKSSSAAKMCASEVGRMQVERNDHYDTLLQAKAENPADPNIGEMWDALAQIRAEDAALKQKRLECMPLLDEVIAAAKELRRNCEAYASAIATGAQGVAADMRAINTCHGSTKGDDEYRLGSR
jgi:hypothetical protein